MDGRFDVVVVGGGHNGLVCAYYLAKAGRSVCVLERHETVGGAAVTEEFHPGFRNSVASYTVSLLQERVVADMGLAELGLRIVPRPLANFLPAADGAGLALHQSSRATQAALRAHSVRDADRYPDYLTELAAVVRLARSTLLEPPLNLRGGWPEWRRALGFLPRLGRMKLRRLAFARALLVGSAGQWLDDWFETDLLKGGLGFDAIVGHYASPYKPGTGYLLLHHALGEVNGVTGAWGHALGGMGAITSAMATAARRQGVAIRVESDVVAIEPHGSGFDVRLDSGKVVAASAVAAAVHPQLLFTRLLRPELLPPPFLARMRSWKSESASFRMNVALSELPDFTCRPGRALADHHTAGILISPSLGYLERAYREARTKGMPVEPVIELLIPSTVDPGLAPPGAHVASLFCQHFPRHPPGRRGWAELKAAAVNGVIETVSRYAPNFRRAVIAVQAFTPEDLERRFGLIGGDIFHGKMTPDQLYWSRPAKGYAQYRTSLKGLYLCASGAHPGGGVSGAPGHNAAQVILRDL